MFLPKLAKLLMPDYFCPVIYLGIKYLSLEYYLLRVRLFVFDNRSFIDSLKNTKIESCYFKGDISIGFEKFRKIVRVSLMKEIIFHVKLTEDGWKLISYSLN